VNRVIFDTNIYGFLAKEPNIDQIEPAIIHNDKLIVYGVPVVRKEIRKTGTKRFRDDLLELYDHVTKGRSLEVTETAERLAEEYHAEAKKLNPRTPSRYELWEDFLIVAVASKNNLDIVFTEDRTLASTSLRQAFDVINLKNGLRSPNFYDYKLLKKSFVK
jgi:predicted nucleic acid-binding protein